MMSVSTAAADSVGSRRMSNRKSALFERDFRIRSSSLLKNSGFLSGHRAHATSPSFQMLLQGRTGNSNFFADWSARVVEASGNAVHGGADGVIERWLCGPGALAAEKINLDQT